MLKHVVAGASTVDHTASGHTSCDDTIRGRCCCVERACSGSSIAHLVACVVIYSWRLPGAQCGTGSHCGSEACHHTGWTGGGECSQRAGGEHSPHVACASCCGIQALAALCTMAKALFTVHKQTLLQTLCAPKPDPMVEALFICRGISFRVGYFASMRTGVAMVVLLSLAIV